MGLIAVVVVVDVRDRQGGRWWVDDVGCNNGTGRNAEQRANRPDMDTAIPMDRLVMVGCSFFLFGLVRRENGDGDIIYCCCKMPLLALVHYF